MLFRSTVSVDQWFSEFSAHPYLGLMDWGPAVLGLDRVSALRTQIVLMQAVLQHALRNSGLQV